MSDVSDCYREVVFRTWLYLLSQEVFSLIAAIVGRIYRIGTLCKLVRIQLLHLDAFWLLALSTVLRWIVSFDRQMVILRVWLATWMVDICVVLRSRTAVVWLWVSLARMSAFLLDENAFEWSSCASIRHHHLLRIVQYLLVVHTRRARILLLSRVEIFKLSLLVSHIWLSIMIYALWSFHIASFVIRSSSIDRGGHSTTLFVLSFDWTSTAFSFQWFCIGVCRRLIQTFQVGLRRLVSDLWCIVIVQLSLADHHTVVIHMLLILHTGQF